MAGTCTFRITGTLTFLLVIFAIKLFLGFLDSNSLLSALHLLCLLLLRLFVTSFWPALKTQFFGITGHGVMAAYYLLEIQVRILVFTF